MAEQNDTVLELKKVTKVFNQGTINEKTALDGLSLTLHKGDFVTIIGGNGAGKSTMLNAIAGVWDVTSGQIVINGADVTRLPEYKRAVYLGRVFQDPMNGTAATMSIDENLALAARRGKRKKLTWGVTAKERERYRQMLKELDLGLEDRLSTKVGLLSGGQRQAITLLMAAMNDPDLLLLDEHTAALDPKTAAKVLALSEKIIGENGLTAMMVTHNMRDAIAHGNRLIMMNAGRIVYDVSGEEKKNLKVQDLLDKFEEVSGGTFANDRMLLNGIVFLISKASFLIDDRVLDTDLTYIMKKRREIDLSALILIHAGKPGDLLRILSDSGRMTVGIPVFGIDGINKRFRSLLKERLSGLLFFDKKIDLSLISGAYFLINIADSDDIEHYYQTYKRDIGKRQTIEDHLKERSNYRQ